MHSRRTLLQLGTRAACVFAVAALTGCGKGTALVAALELRPGANDSAYAKELLTWVEGLPRDLGIEGRMERSANGEIVRMHSESLEALKEHLLTPIRESRRGGPPPPSEGLALAYQRDELEFRGKVVTTYRLEIYDATGGFIPQGATVKQTDGEGRVTGRLTIELSKKDAEAFADLSETLVNRELMVVLEGEVLSSPRVAEPITGGKVVLTSSSPVEAKTLFKRFTGRS